MKATLQVAPEDCTGCGACVNICPVKDKADEKRKAINLEPQAALRDTEAANWEFFLKIPNTDPQAPEPRPAQGHRDAPAPLRVLRRLRRLRRDALHQAPHPARGRPRDHLERDRLLLDLRRQPPHHALYHQRRGQGPRLVQQPLRGRGGVRLRHAHVGRQAHASTPASS